MKRLSQTFWMLSFLLIFPLSGCNQEQGTRYSEKAGSGSKIEMVSHRGANRQAPENTYASAQKAIEAGAAYIEVDVSRSKDGVYYIFHDSKLDRTTNGTGLFSEASSEYIDGLDAGSWFGHEFAGERVPRLKEFLEWIKGKAKVYFDWKDADLKDLLKIVYELGFEDDCFFWFSDSNFAREFRTLDQKLALKMNASSVSQLDTMVSVYNAQIIECGVNDLTEEFLTACRTRGLKVMPYIPGNDLYGYRKAIEKKVDMINLDVPHIFANMVENDGVFKKYKLIAHRGGITGNEYNEFDPVSIQKAIDLGYYMLEIDVRMTKDGVLIVNHDANFLRFFNDPGRVDEMTYDEIKKLKSDRGDYHPLSFEEVAKMCSGKIKMMIDDKVSGQPAEYYKKLGDIMDKYDLLDGAYFIKHEPRQYFWGRAKFHFRMSEIPEMMEKLARGEDVVCHYFLFDNGNRLTSSAIKWCQQNSISVVPSVNYSHYRLENHWQGAKRDIEFLKECGVTGFQIDSHYDQWLPFQK